MSIWIMSWGLTFSHLTNFHDVWRVYKNVIVMKKTNVFLIDCIFLKVSPIVSFATSLFYAFVLKL